MVSQVHAAGFRRRCWMCEKEAHSERTDAIDTVAIAANNTGSAARTGAHILDTGEPANMTDTDAARDTTDTDALADTIDTDALADTIDIRVDIGRTDAVAGTLDSAAGFH